MKYLILFIVLSISQTLAAQLVPVSKGKFSKIELWDYSRYREGQKVEASVESSQIEVKLDREKNNGVTVVDIMSEFFGNELKRLPIRSVLKVQPIADIILYQCIIDNGEGRQAESAFVATLRDDEIMEFALWFYDEKGAVKHKIVFVR